MPVPQPYNLTLAGNVTGFVDLAQKVNETFMHNLLGVAILITVFAIVFISFMATTGHGGKAYLGACFITFLLTIMLRIMELVVTDLILYGSMILMLAGVALVKVRE